MDALVIVHLSSLDAFAEREGMEEARELAARLRDRIVNFMGAVYVIDQRWPAGEHSAPRYKLVKEIELQRDIRFVHFDDQNDDWMIFLKQFRAQLIRDGIRNVILGGVWYHPGGEAGCVSEAYTVLRRNLRVRVDRDLVGCLS